MAKFTKRHYEAIADIFADAHRGTTVAGKPMDNDTLFCLEGKLSNLFAKDSPRYDKRKFYGRIDKGRGF